MAHTRSSPRRHGGLEGRMLLRQRRRVAASVAYQVGSSWSAAGHIAQHWQRPPTAARRRRRAPPRRRGGVSTADTRHPGCIHQVRPPQAASAGRSMPAKMRQRRRPASGRGGLPDRWPGARLPPRGGAAGPTAQHPPRDLMAPYPPDLAAHAAVVDRQSLGRSSPSRTRPIATHTPSCTASGWRHARDGAAEAAQVDAHGRSGDTAAARAVSRQ